MVRRDKSGSEVETGWKRRRNRYGLHTGSSGSTRERDWVVGSQILTLYKDSDHNVFSMSPLGIWVLAPSVRNPATAITMSVLRSHDGR